MADVLDLIAYKLKLEEFITSNFSPAENIGTAAYTYTTKQFIMLLENNFTEIPVEILSSVLQDLEFKQTLFDNEFVWLINRKI